VPMQPMFDGDSDRSRDLQNQRMPGTSWKKVLKSDYRPAFTNSLVITLAEIRVKYRKWKNEIFVWEFPLLVFPRWGKNLPRTDSVGRPHSDISPCGSSKDSKPYFARKRWRTLQSYGGGAIWVTWIRDALSPQFTRSWQTMLAHNNIYGGQCRIMEFGFGNSKNVLPIPWEPLMGWRWNGS